MSASIKIEGKEIGVHRTPYIVAEISANHNGSIDKAMQLIKAAKDSGAHAVKLQTYTADTITLDCNHEEFLIKEGLWQGRSLYDLYGEAYTPWDWHPKLFQFARDIGITIFSSPFDYSAIDFLEELNTPAYKIASFEAVDLPLIRYAAKTGKPLIISTGMANLDEIDAAVAAATEAGCGDIAILRCVSSYPAPACDYNLRTIPHLMGRHRNAVVGLSDHTLDNATAIASIALGASIIEKHFTLDRDGGGPDDSFSLEPEDLANLCTSANTAWEALGRIDYARKSSEVSNIKFRRSLYFVRDIAAGDTVAENAVRSIRPGYGLPPDKFDEVVGKKVKFAIKKGTAVAWELLECGD